MEGTTVEIWERQYDNHKDDNGNEKSNTMLGKFYITKVLRQDFYASKMMGLMNGKRYLIEEYEVIGSGSRFEIDLID